MLHREVEFVAVSWARSRGGPVVAAGSRTMHISNITDASSKFVNITHECRDSKKNIYVKSHRIGSININELKELR